MYNLYYKGRYYKRVGASNRLLKGTALIEFLLKKSNRTWDGFVESTAQISDLEEIFIKPFKKEETENTSNTLSNLDLLIDGKLKRAAVLLFGKEPQKFYPNSYIQIGQFADFSTVLSTDIIKGCLFKQAEEAITILKKKYLKLEHSFKDPIKRNDTLEYSERALREAIFNAIIHRDYSGNAAIQIKIFDTRLEIWNTGNLLEEINLEDLRKEHNSAQRNPLIANVFFHAGLIEKWGTGTLEIIKACKGRFEPEFKEIQNGFAVVIYKIFTEEYLRGKKKLNERQIKAILYLKENKRIKSGEYQEKRFSYKNLLVLYDVDFYALGSDFEIIQQTSMFEKTSFIAQKWTVIFL